MRSKDEILLAEAYSAILEEKKKKLSDKQKKIASVAEPKDEITGADFKKLKEENVDLVGVEMADEHPHFSEGGEEQEESSMNETNLSAICKNAKMLMSIVKSGADLDTWMQQSLAVIADNITSVAQVAVYDFNKNNTYTEAKQVNPWAVCGKIEDKPKKERCVKGVKKSAKKYGKKITSKSVKAKNK
jgi:hypothetical protein